MMSQERLQAIGNLIRNIRATGKDSGTTMCPLCKGTVRFCVNYNGHIWAACENAEEHGCIALMQ